MAFRPPSFSSIAAFEAAARHGSFTAAARELNLTQSAVSHAIKGLEARCGGRLFDRRGRGVALTAAGRRLAGKVRLSMALLGDAFDDRSRQAPELLRIATLASFAGRILLPLLADMKQAWPDLRLEILCGDALADIDSGEADLAIRFGPGGWAGLHAVRLANEWLFPVASPSYRNGDLPSMPEELAACDLISHPESAWRLWLERSGIDSDAIAPALTVNDAVLILEAAKAGLGIALARATLVETDLKAGSLVRLFDRKVPAEYSYWCVWNPSSPKRASIERFVDLLTDRVQAHLG